MFTGMYPPRLEVRDNVSPPLSDEFNTLAEMLRQRRMKTAAFVASAILAPRRGLEQGFDHYGIGEPQRCSNAPPLRRRAGEVVDEAISWLRRNSAEPFFVWVHLFDTHRPYDLPADYKDRHFDPYLAAVAYEDAQLARLLEDLESRNVLNRTLTVVVGDHGESLGDHGEESHGVFLDQEALRVPFMMRGPGVPAGRATEIARLIDVMPTILELFGVKAAGLDGVSLANRDSGSRGKPELEVYAESMYPRRFGWAALRALRADRYKVIDAPRAELYDLAVDPGEERNVLADHPAVAAAMLARVRSFDSAPPPPPEPGVDAELVERLSALGYVGGAGAQPLPGAGDNPDPKDRIDLFNRITSQQWSQAERKRSLCR
jgi:arylsulfatase A-like enzyme